MKKYHYVYRTTNKVTGKFYIGAHSTNNIHDNYYGSGIQIKQAIKKYGLENFTFEILEFFETRKQAFEKEFLLVNEQFIQNSDNYNMTVGGLGSSVKTEQWKNQVSSKLKGRKFTEEHSRKKSLAQTGQKNHRYGKPNPKNPKLKGKENGMYGKHHTEETRKQISNSRKKSKVNLTEELITAYSNACKGKLWYNDGNKSRRFYENQQPSGYTRGRL